MSNPFRRRNPAPPSPPTTDGNDMRGVLTALVTVTVLVAAVSFALTAYGLYGYGREVWELPLALAIAVPLMVDLQSICAGIATYALRNALGRTRVYAWMVFILCSIVSVLGNEAFAQHRELSTFGRIGSALPPIFLASAVHLVIVVRRHLERSKRPAVAPPTELKAAPAPPPRVTAEPAQVAAERPAPPPPAQVPPKPRKPAQRPAAAPVSPAAGGDVKRDEQGRVKGSARVPAREKDGRILIGDALAADARWRILDALNFNGRDSLSGSAVANWYDPPMSRRWGVDRINEVLSRSPSEELLPTGLIDARHLDLVGEVGPLAELPVSVGLAPLAFQPA